MISERLETLRKRTGMSAKAFATFLGVKYTTYYGYEKGTRQPDSDFLMLVAEKMGVSIDWIMGLSEEIKPRFATLAIDAEERELIEKYRSLSDKCKDIVSDIVNYMSENKQSVLRSYPYIGKLAAAGSSVFSYDIPVRVIQAKPVLNAELIVGVNGDSMEPTLADGSMVYVQRARELNIGEIGIFQRGDEYYIKELGADGLISHNKKYPVMHGEFCCVGKVLGVVDA